MNIPEELRDTDLLFHFTNAYIAMEDILYERKIRFSPFANMNDPYEYKIVSLGVQAWGGISEETASEAMYRLRDTILYKSKLLSIVRSKEKNIEDDYQLVFTKPRLWAQYAEAQYGVCLIFSLNSFLEKIKISYPGLTVYHDYVAYDLSKGKESLKTDLRDYDTSLSIDDNIRTHFEIKKKDIFFRKYEDFGDENEYRIVLIDWEDNRNRDIYIDIKEIIRGVILGERFHDVYKDTVKDIVMNKLNANLYRISYDASYVALKKY
jgi:hypothetical protein